jgi:hypothetical protein
VTLTNKDPGRIERAFAVEKAARPEAEHADTVARYFRDPR